MSTQALSTLQPDAFPVVQIVLDGLTSAHSKRAYGRALNNFLGWYRTTGQTALTKAVVQHYASELTQQGMGASSINQRLSAIRKLAAEAGDNALLPEGMANGIKNVKGVRQEGKRMGNWLTLEQAQTLIDLPDINTLKGLRDRALLSVLIGCGLRRTEAAALAFEHIQQREGRWVIVDLTGKRNKTRSIPMPTWCKAAMDAYSTRAGINTGRVFRPVNKGDRMAGYHMTPQAVYNQVAEYSRLMGVALAAHDLRRTFAKLAHKGGAAIEQIQLSLGHGSIKTTEIYLGVDQNLTDAPGDRIKLTVAGK